MVGKKGLLDLFTAACQGLLQDFLVIQQVEGAGSPFGFEGRAGNMVRAWRTILRPSMLACLQGTFRIKPGVSDSFKSLLSRSYVRVSLAPSDHGKQSLRLQVFLNESAFQDCCASGKLLTPPASFRPQGDAFVMAGCAQL